MIATYSDDDGESWTESLDSKINEFTGRQVPDTQPDQATADELLVFMRWHRRVYGHPLPDGFVPPPGIDIAELLQRLPPEGAR